MSSGTFSYPLGFTALLAVIGLAVSSTTREYEKGSAPHAADMAVMADQQPVKAAESPKLEEESASGAELCRLGDAYKDQRRLDEALDRYKKAVWTDSPDDVIQYALDSATGILQGNKDWEGIAKLHSEFITRNPDSQLAMLSVTWVAKMDARQVKSAEATENFAKTLKSRIGDPAAVQTEFLLDELVKSMVPRKKAKDMDADALDRQLVELLEKVAGPDANATARVRICYARARLAQLLKRFHRSELFLKDLAQQNAKDPSVLSPQLLSECGNTLLKSGDVDGAERTYQWLKDHFAAGFGNTASVGLGNVALARKKPEEALGIFNDVLDRNPVVGALPGAMIGKLQALSELNRPDEAIALALELLDKKAFKGEPVVRIYLLLGRAYETKADGAGAEAKGFLQKAFGSYQRVWVAYAGYPELSKEALRRADEVKKKL